MTQDIDTAVGVAPDREDLEQFVSYEDGADLVVVDREVTTAWVRSDETVPVEP